MNRRKPSPTCDLLMPKHRGWWRCGRPAAVKSVREQLGFPGDLSIVHFCRHHQRHACEHAPWIRIVKNVKVYPSASRAS